MPFKTGSKDVTFSSEGVIDGVAPTSAILNGGVFNSSVQSFDNGDIGAVQIFADGVLQVAQTGHTVIDRVDVSVTTSPTQLTAQVCKEVLIKNVGANKVRIGATTITATRGDQLGAGDFRVYSVSNTNLLFHRTESGSSSISVLAVN